MDPNEMLSIILRGDWRVVETNENCSFRWSDPDQSIILEFTSGERQGQKFSHQFVKIYRSKEENTLDFQSNLFHTVMKLHSETGPLIVGSDVFKNMELVRN